MNILYCKIRYFACASLVLLCACGEIDTYPDTYSQRCSDTAAIDGFQADFGGYKKGKRIPYKHSDGYLFALTVTDRENYIDGASEKHLVTTLESAYPIYSVTVSGKTGTFYYDGAQKNRQPLEIEFGQYVFTVVDPLILKEVLHVAKVNGKDTLLYGPDSNYIEKMEVNGVTYKDVAVSHGEKYKSFNNKYSTVKSDAKLYYQTKKGILKIELEDGSHIAINEEDD